MFQIILYSNAEGKIIKFSCEGHAGYHKEGINGDIVCSAISVLVLNTINSIERFTQDACSYRADDADGRIEFAFQETPSDESTLLLNSMILGLQSIADQREYEEFIDLTFEEV